MAKKSIFDDDSVSELDMVETAQNDAQIDEILDEFDDTQDTDDYETDQSPPTKFVSKPPAKKAKTSSAYSMNSQESDIMSSALIQLEQARLYDMFLKHDLFEGVKTNPTALKRVQKELKDFILERLQILLGMKTEKKLETVQQVKVELPFNSVEIEFLKDLSFRGTKGASAQAKPVQVKALSSLKQVEVEESNPGLKKLKVEEEDEPEVEEIFEEEEEVEETPPAPVVKKKIQQPSVVRKPTRKVLVTDEEVKAEQKRLAKSGIKLSEDIIRAAKEDLKKMAKRDTPAHLMNEDQLREEAIKNGNTKKAVPKNALPMPGADAQITHYMTQQMQRQHNSDNQNLMAIIAKRLSTTDVHQDNGED